MDFSNTGILHVQDAVSYLHTAIPDSLRSTRHFNTVISSALHHSRLDIGEDCLQSLEQHGLDWDALTWSLAIRLRVCATTQASLAAESRRVQGLQMLEGNIS